MKGKVISESKIEYVTHTTNPWLHCQHRCNYCYARLICKKSMKQWGTLKTRPDYLKNLEYDLNHLTFLPHYDLLCATLTDPYQPYYSPFDIMDVWRLFSDFGSPKIRVITKNGFMIRNHIDFFAKNYDQFVVGLTITADKDSLSKPWEPYASPNSVRLLALEELHRNGVNTWASVEPILPGTDVEHHIRTIAPYIRDKIVVGKLNYSKADFPDNFYRETYNMLMSLQEELTVSIYIKQELLESAFPTPKPETKTLEEFLVEETT